MMFTSIPQNRHFKISMIPNMIPLVSKYSQIIKGIVVLVAILVMYDMPRLEAKVFTNNSTSDPGTMVMHNKWVSVPMFQPGMITLLTTKRVLSCPEPCPVIGCLLPADSTGDSYSPVSLLTRINPGPSQYFPDALPGHSVLFSKGNHGYQFNCVGPHYVNCVSIGVFHGYYSYV